MERLVGLLGSSMRGRGAVVTITGDHGVGKTRLARELCALAERAGAGVLWGQARDDEGSPAYGPWAEIVIRHIERVGRARARALMGGGAGDIARMLPGLDTRRSPASQSPEPPSPEARFRLFVSMRSYLRRVADAGPLVLVLDDLHYCDPDSLRLLEAVADDLRDSRTLLVGTCVEKRAARHPALAAVLEGLTKLPWHERLAIGNLSREETHRLLAREVGDESAAGFADLVHARTDGNPLFVIQAARALATRAARSPAAAPGEGWERGAAESAGILATRRMARLSEAARGLVRMAAVLGRDVDVGLLARAASLAPARVRRLLGESVEEGLIADDGGDRFRFAHEIVQSGILETLAPAARSSIHRAAGEALEAVRAEGAAVEPAALAWHFEAAGIECRDKAVRYLREAGTKALESAAYDTALRCFDAASRDPQISVSQRAELASLRARSLFALGRFLDVTPRLAEAFDLYEAAGDTQRAAGTAQFADYPGAAARLPREDLRRLQARALSAVPPDSVAAAGLLCALAEGRSYADHRGAASSFARALDLARAHGDRGLESRVLHAWAWLEYRTLNMPECLRMGAQALEIARETRDRDSELVFGGRLGVWRLCAGDCRGAEELARDLRSAGEGMRSSVWAYDLQALIRLLAVWRGRWSDYHREVKHAQWLREPGVVSREKPASGEPVGIRTAAEVLAIVESNPDYYIDPDRIAARAAGAADASRALGDRSCVEQVKRLAERALAMEPSSWGNLHALVALGVAAVMESDLESLRRVCTPELAAAPADFILECPGYAIDSVRGLFWGRLGKDAEARRYFDAALAFSRRGELIWEHAWTCCYYAAFLARRGEWARARALAAEARRIGWGLGMLGFEQELAEVERTVGEPLPDGLTERELQVIRLVAAGRSTKEIAGDLSISHHTATNHLRHIYRKARVTNRVDLARYAADKRIVPAAGASK